MSPLFFTVLWVAYVIIHMTISSYFSYRTNLNPEKMWFWLTIGIGLIPTWAIIARYSKNIASDAILYDTLITVIYFVSLTIFTGNLNNTHWYHWVGFTMAIVGALMTRI